MTHCPRALIFGCGSGGQLALPRVAREAEVVGFLDNDPARQLTRVRGLPVYAPAALPVLDYDVIYVASAWADDIRRQLTAECGVPAERLR